MKKILACIVVAAFNQFTGMAFAGDTKPATVTLGDLSFEDPTWGEDQILPRPSGFPSSVTCKVFVHIKTPVGLLVQSYAINYDERDLSRGDYKTLCRNSRAMLHDFLYDIEQIGDVRVIGIPATDHSETRVTCSKAKMVLVLEWNQEQTIAKIVKEKMVSSAVPCP